MTINNIHKTIFLFLSWLVFNGCTKEIDLGLEKKPRRIVIEGNVYNTPGPYFIRITLSNPALSNTTGDGGIDYAEGIKNALVIISDNVGTVDTLVPSPDSIRRTVKFYRSRTSPIDSFFLDDLNYYNGERGFYQTTKLKGEPGRTYTLKVIHEQQEYSATAFMPPVTVLDSVQIKTREFIKDHSMYKLPAMYFSEPQNSTDYYWTFVVGNVNDPNAKIPLLYSTREILPYSIFNDKFLQPYVNGIYSDFTYTKNSIAVDIIPAYGFVYLGSLTEQHYNFLKTIIDQLQSDGGTYKPTPSTPPTNISNNGLGFFGASAVSRVFTFSPDFY